MKLHPLDRIEKSFSLRLAVILGIVVLLIAALGVGVWVVTADAVRDDVRSQMVAQSEAEADGLTEWFASNRQYARLVSEDSRFRTGNTTEVTDYLERQLDASDPDVVGLHYIDTRDQRIVATTVAGAENESLGDRPWSSRLRYRSFDDVFVSEPYVTPRGRTVVAFVSPTGDVNGALVVLVDVSDMAETFRSPIPGTTTTVVDSRGTVVFSEDPDRRLQPYLQNETAIPEALVSGIDGRSGFQYDSLKERELGYDVVTAYAPVEGTDWVVIKHAPAASAYAVIDRIKVGIAGVAGLGILGVLLVALTFGRNTTRAVSRLTETATAYAEGDYDFEPNLTRSDELGTLATQMSQMRDALRNRIAALEVARTKAQRGELHLQRLLTNLPVVLFVIGADGRFSTVEGHTPTGTFALDDALGERYDEHFAEYEPLVECCRRALRGHSQSVTVDVDGGIYHIQPHPVVHGGVVQRVVVTASDVTEQRNREQQIQVLNRVLRHDLRNRLNVVISYAHELREGATDPTDRDLLDRIIQHAEELVDTSEKARNIQQALDDADRPIDVTEVVRAAVGAVCERYPAVDIHTDLEPNAMANATVHLGTAVTELIENAVEHGSTAHQTQSGGAVEQTTSRASSGGDQRATATAPSADGSGRERSHDGVEDDGVEIRISVTSDDEWVELLVEDDGDGMPEDEQAALLSGEETPLEHTSGLGLWFVYWLVTVAGGRFSFEESSLGGLGVKLTFHRADGA
ncbi:cache domain-containing protein [Haloarchaeobius sp. DFWS5]|uniref:cache domain-containing protein n=1 Tax=Haloarchaeobius sp. DFWS5 TaxID=3446114 RepID=UPI003EBE3D7C